MSNNCFNNPCGQGGGCGCGINTCRVCGEWEEPENQDTGKCHSYRVKRNCEAPAEPDPGPCDDTEYTIIYTPDLTPPFRVQARLFDENCEEVLDQDDNPIMTTFAK
jgi:hypothetical protein